MALMKEANRIFLQYQRNHGFGLREYAITVKAEGEKPINHRRFGHALVVWLYRVLYLPG